MKINPVVHFEMPYENHERLMKFYASVFNWQMKKFGEEMGNYVTASTTKTDEKMMPEKPGSINGGFFPKDATSAKYPSIVIAVDNIEETIKKIKEAGGKILDKPIDIPTIGKYISFIDTEWNRVGVLEPVRM